MKRSQINKSLDEAISYFNKSKYPLPSFAFWTLSDWQKNKKKASEIINTRLGWDVTDFGSGDLNYMGRTIFTLRNGLTKSKKYPKSYSQKVMHMKPNQLSPIHFHINKTEDIINHFGGDILIKLWNKTKNNKLSKSKVTYSLSGINKTINPGKTIRIKTGESINISPNTFHQFWADKNLKPVVSQEISSVNNDLTDNIWLEKNKTRFPKIEEDVPRKFILCNEYYIL